MPLNHPDIDEDPGRQNVEGPAILAAIDDAFDRDPSIVCAVAFPLAPALADMRV